MPMSPERLAQYEARAAAAAARQQQKNPEWYAAVTQSNLSEKGITVRDVQEQARAGAASDAAARAIENTALAGIGAIPGVTAATGLLAGATGLWGASSGLSGIQLSSAGGDDLWGGFGGSVENILGAIPGVLGAVGVSVPAWLTTALGAAGTAYGIYQALGGGEGEGLFGNNLLGGDSQSVPATTSGGDMVTGNYLAGIPLGGPGLAEPPAAWVENEWHVNYTATMYKPAFKLQYYLVRMPTGGRKIAVYNTYTKRWKAWAWRKPHLAVIGKNMPSHKQLTRLRRNLSRHKVDARTVLKLVSPSSLAKPKRRRR